MSNGRFFCFVFGWMDVSQLRINIVLCQQNVQYAENSILNVITYYDSYPCIYIYICMVDNLRKFIENSVLNIVSIEVKNISSTLGYVYMTVPMEVASSRTVHLPTMSTARISEISMLVKSHFRLRSGHCRHCYSDFCFSVPAISK